MEFAGFDHIDLRVADLAADREFYDALCLALGLSEIVETPGVREYYEAGRAGESRRFLGLTADPEHRPNKTRICFAARSPSDVDRVAAIIAPAGARGVEGPEIPYSSEKYYAVFFEDGAGNRFEVAYRRPHHVAAAVALDESQALADLYAE